MNKRIRRGPAKWIAVGWIAIAAASVLAIAGCGETQRPPSSGKSAASTKPTQRLVTLAPALTHMVQSLGLRDRLVGVAKNDAIAPHDSPVVGTYTSVNTEALLSVEPTHVLMMSTKAGPPDRVKELAAEGLFELVSYRYPRRIEDVGRILHTTASADRAKSEPPPPGLGLVLNQAERASRLKAQMFGQLRQLKKQTHHWRAPEVLLAIGTNPLVVTGPGTINDQLLDYVNARNVAEHAATTAPSFNREALLTHQPQVIVVLDPGGAPLQPNDPRLSEFRGLAIPAVQNERIHLLNDPAILLPSTNLSGTAAALAKAIRPDRAEAIDRVMQNKSLKKQSPSRH
jgi:ABC-type hemin transport system substrate-binding protein